MILKKICYSVMTVKCLLLLLRRIVGGKGKVLHFHSFQSYIQLLAMVRPNTSCLLSVLVALATTLPTPGYREEANLLTSIGLGHLTSKFEAPEVEIEHMADLDNTELTSLGNHSFPLLTLYFHRTFRRVV